MARYKAIPLRGPWRKGYALDLHTISSEFVGYDESGHEKFETRRTEVGELVYRLKYGRDESALSELISAATSFLKDDWGIVTGLDMVSPVPPSNTARPSQPVFRLASGIAEALGLEYAKDTFRKTRETSELKDINEHDRRLALLSGAFDVNVVRTRGKNMLIVDDLYRSGATAEALTRLALGKGQAKAVYFLALTRTRSKR